MKHRPVSLRLTALLSTLLLVCQVSAQDTPAETTGEIEPIGRVAVVGASASAGFGIVIMKNTVIGRIPGSWTMAQTLRAASQNSIVVSDLGTSMFFLAPQKNGESLMKRAIKARPDLVIAIDFLFWYCYGNKGFNGARMQTPKERMQMLEVGLAMLDTYDGPIVVGDLPDMSGAIGHMLSRSQVPKPKTLEALNAKIHEWAEQRPRITIFPLAEITHKLGKGQNFSIGEHEWDEELLAGSLQRDQLHPTLDGQIALIQVLESLILEDEELSSRFPELKTDRNVLRARIEKKTPRKKDATQKSSAATKRFGLPIQAAA